VFHHKRFVAALATEQIGRAFQYQPVVGSTMDVARTAAQDGAPHGYTVLADEQTAGRGRFARRWIAPAGANLTFTILVRPDRAVLERLSIVAALAVAGGVQRVTGVEPRFKWPNDVHVDERKLAGILVEAAYIGDTPAFALVGIGLNVNAETSTVAEISAIAVSLRDLLGVPVEREPLLAAVLASFEYWYERASEGQIVDDWAARLTTIGRQITVSFAGTIEHGVAESVTESGALCLRRTDGTVVVLPAGEVTTQLT